MDNDPHVIADLMNKLADARATLNQCLCTLARDDEPARLEIAETLRPQIAGTIAEIDVARFKVLKRITAEPSPPQRPKLPPTPSRPRPPSSVPPRARRR